LIVIGHQLVERAISLGATPDDVSPALKTPRMLMRPTVLGYPQRNLFVL
jgi:hypothetical protein